MAVPMRGTRDSNFVSESHPEGKLVAAMTTYTAIIEEILTLTSTQDAIIRT
jgi:hypothetical protein